MTTHSLTPSRIIILIVAVVFTGMSQGLLLPMLSLILEQEGVSSGVNGLHAASLYVGVFLAMFVVERIVRTYGYKRSISLGFVIVLISCLIFPLYPSMLVWVILRLLVGIGDSLLHYATQLWIVSASPKETRGRNIAFYGMSYAIGFSLGPLGINLLDIAMWLPFVTMAVCLSVALALMQLLPHDYPEPEERRGVAGETKQAYGRIYRLAWFALLPALMFGYMEASLNSNFPVYGLRTGLTEQWISVLLPAVGVGSLVLQIPLGIASDRWGRKKWLVSSGGIGGLAFLSVPFMPNEWALLACLALAGGFVGSFFSLGLAYAADLLPRSLLPKANIVASIHFSIGSIIGPNLGGMGIQWIHPASMFLMLGGMYILFVSLGLWHRSVQIKGG
ncbi:MFS transporter [Marinicrinis sediminis]|uniref:MFS transporter n=1 Tax=Marinicrinis sediminis TaxID=1652465 RepID=A0ABW5RDI3_9BACL